MTINKPIGMKINSNLYPNGVKTIGFRVPIAISTPRAVGRRTSLSRRPRAHDKAEVAPRPARETTYRCAAVPVPPGSAGAARHARIWSSGVPSAAGGGASATATPARQRRNLKTSAPSCARVQKSSANRSGRRRADHRLGQAGGSPRQLPALSDQLGAAGCPRYSSRRH